MKNRTIVIANQKGGVGKTTTAVNLAHGLALRHRPTLLIDLDPQGQTATALGLAQENGIFNWLAADRPVAEVIRQARPNLHLIPGDKTTAHAQILLNARSEPLDYLTGRLQPFKRRTGPAYIIIDTSPSVGGLQERALFAADLVIIPTACDYLSADSVAAIMENLATNTEYLWPGSAAVLPTFYDRVTNESSATLDQLISAYGPKVWPVIHRATTLREAAAAGKTIWEYNPRSRAGQDYSNTLHLIMRESQ